MPNARARRLIASELVARFGDDLDRLLTGRRPSANGKIGVAVSGGPDSLALLLLARAARPDGIIAATVDHGFRPEAAGEAAEVAAICAALGVPHAILRPESSAAGSLQMRARAMRYRALAVWGEAERVDAILTAHHVDDQAETLLMRLNRGAGAAGLAGIRATAEIEGATILRPLLAWRHVDLAAIVAAAGLMAVDDPANRDPRHDRTAARALLQREPWLEPARLARSAAILADVEAALAFVAEVAWRDRATEGEAMVTISPSGLPRELRRRLLARALARLGERHARGDAIDRLLTALDAGRQGSLGAVLARSVADGWHLCHAPPRRSA